MWLDLITLTAFLTTFVTALVFGMTVLQARRRVRNIADIAEPRQRSRPGPFRRALASAVPMFPGETETLEQDLRRAGFYGSEALIEYLAARNFISVGTLVVGGAAAVISDPTTTLPQTILMSSTFAAVLTYVLPRFLLHLQANRRLGQILTGLPDALDLIRMCLSGGLPLRDSLMRVAKDVEFFHPDMAVELEVVRQHAEADTMQKALLEFARRMRTPDINALASLVSQTQRTGTHVASAVTEFADGIRRQSRQRTEERANQTSIKLLFPVILCLAPPVFILLVGPPLLQLRNFIRDAHEPGGVLEQQAGRENLRPLMNLDQIAESQTR